MKSTEWYEDFPVPIPVGCQDFLLHPLWILSHHATCLLAGLLNLFLRPWRWRRMFLQNVGWNSMDYTASYPRRWYSVSSVHNTKHKKSRSPILLCKSNLQNWRQILLPPGCSPCINCTWKHTAAPHAGYAKLHSETGLFHVWPNECLSTDYQCLRVPLHSAHCTWHGKYVLVACIHLFPSDFSVLLQTHVFWVVSHLHTITVRRFITSSIIIFSTGTSLPQWWMLLFTQGLTGVFQQADETFNAHSTHRRR
jgi:hypothetical protein